MRCVVIVDPFTNWTHQCLSAFKMFFVCRALLQTQVPRPPISTTRRNSPMMDRKSVGAPLHTRLRRFTNVGISASEKHSSKRNASLGPVANPDFESNGIPFLPVMLIVVYLRKVSISQVYLFLSGVMLDYLLILQLLDFC